MENEEKSLCPVDFGVIPDCPSQEKGDTEIEETNLYKDEYLSFFKNETKERQFHEST